MNNPVRKGDASARRPDPLRGCLLFVLYSLLTFSILPKIVFAEETLYISVYLNKKNLADIIEAFDKEGRVFVDIHQIAILLESPPPEAVPDLIGVEDLETFFPAAFIFSEKQQVLVITGRGELPIEKRLERERIHKLLALRSKDDTEYEEVPLDYRFFSPPSFDISSSYENDGESRFVYSLFSVSEALYGTLRLQTLGFDDEISDLRASWEHVEHNGSIQVGDIFSPALNLVARAEAGRGFIYSTFPRERTNQFDRETIQGLLNTGWEVELYRNGALLDFRANDGTGRFVFEDVPLLFGENEILLRYHGPQGQIRDEVRKVLIGGAMVPPGEAWVRTGIMEQGENLFFGRDSQTRNNVEGLRATGEMFYGLTKNLTLSSSITKMEIQNDEERIYGQMGVRGAYFGASQKLDFLLDDVGGNALEFAMQRNLFDATVRYSHVEFFDMVTELERDLTRRDTVKIDGYFNTVSLGIEAERETTSRGITFYDLLGRVSGRIHRVWLTNRLEATVAGGNQVTGNFLASGRPTNSWNLRGTLDYNLSPIAQFQSVSGNTDYKIDRNFRLRLGLSKSFIGNRTYTINPGISWDTARAAYGLSGSYSTADQEFQVIASLTFSLSPNVHGNYRMSRTPATSVSRINVRVFQDNNENSTYDEGDDLLPKVRLKRRAESTDDQGILTIPYPPHQLARLELNKHTLENPYSIPPKPVSVRPRLGRQIMIDLPVWETGEIEGSAEPGTDIELLKDGKVIAEMLAEFDGFILFEKIRFGTYTVRMEDAEATVTISREHPVGVISWGKID